MWGRRKAYSGLGVVRMSKGLVLAEQPRKRRWLGRRMLTFAGIPAPAADGLNAEAVLANTADSDSRVFFIKM